jgi:hypothetical protein
VRTQNARRDRRAVTAAERYRAHDEVRRRT